MDGDGHNLPGLPYPKEPIRHVSHRLRHRPHSSRKQWGRRPDYGISFGMRDKMTDRINGIKQTSGKVPLEKTLKDESVY